MATSERIITTALVMKEVERVNVQLNLSILEAAALLALLNNVGGSPSHNRGVSDEVRHALILALQKDGLDLVGKFQRSLAAGSSDPCCRVGSMYFDSSPVPRAP
ncbi:MAG TPA: hypothetical protein PKV98_04430 [Burkholderiaceae bacterium]|nr:hypothetical protein [Burkholderiaceae bacterium]